MVQLVIIVVRVISVARRNQCIGIHKRQRTRADDMVRHVDRMMVEVGGLEAVVSPIDRKRFAESFAIDLWRG